MPEYLLSGDRFQLQLSRSSLGSGGLGQLPTPKAYSWTPRVGGESRLRLEWDKIYLLSIPPSI